MMAHFYIYGDESGKLAKSDFTSFCGYVGTNPEFDRVSHEWNSCRLAWGVPPMHMSCITDPTRDKSGEWQKVQVEWGSQWESKRDLMLKEFAAVILNSNIACVGAVVDSTHFREMPDSKWKKEMRDPLFLGLWTLLMDGLDKIDRLSTSLSVALILDDDPENAKLCYDLLDGLKNQFPRVRQRISAITFGDDKEYPALQMADMIAFEARSLMVQRMADKNVEPSTHFMALTRRLCHQPKFWSAEFLDKLARANG
jgi:hypothetical protein